MESSHDQSFSPRFVYPVPEIIPPPYEFGYHHKDYLKDYKGCMVMYPMYLTLDEVETFKASPLDIAVCSFIKSGTNWMNGIVMGILADGNRNAFHEQIAHKMPYFCHAEPETPVGQRAIDKLKRAPPGRTFYTHLAYQALPSSMRTSGAKKIYIYRNPKDVTVSMYHFAQIQRRIAFQGDLNDMVDSIINDKVEYGPYFDHLASYWSQRNSDPSIFFCSFEELRKDFTNVVTRLALFLGKDLTADQIAVIKTETTFENYQANPHLNKSILHTMGYWDFNKSLFVRNGTVGQWKHRFTPEMNEKMDRWIEHNMTRPELQGLTFEFE